MGDNRDQSADSRFSLDRQGLGGPVPWENIGGRAEFITFSLDGNATLEPADLVGGRSAAGRAGTSLHPGTRQANERRCPTTTASRSYTSPSPQRDARSRDPRAN